ncbi:response regulator [Actinoplanes palleronii]|uniref:Response regulator receiver modulated metal-depenent phosphohydrolase n=1 Tax=Actinoplanes palleronii TaxID=113570 RepID=A0ABQ4BBQ6_9ACTN|nr:response regulator [Actinoplanes palleronii]GIE68105.1 response regulator receiver modulated metal-depenent phosphohydrolase [Actinoplanes palleronii]
MADRILMVDDEQRLLDGLRRSLHGRYAIDFSTSGADGLTRIATAPSPYAVVVSDMMMPVMNGAEFLARTREVSPDSVQIILSGQADLTSTIAAVNDGNLFRFLTKPCEPDNLTRALDAALHQHRLIMAERELLQRTLDGTVELLTDLMKAASPLAAARSEQLRALVDAVAPAGAWEPRIAAMLGQVGLLAIPGELLGQVRAGETLDHEATTLFRSHPQLAYELIRRIPRLERVADWVAAQPLAPGEKPVGQVDHDQLPYAAAVALVVGIEAGGSPSAVATELAHYPSELVDSLVRAYTTAKTRKPRKVTGAEFVMGMVVNQDVLTANGLVLVRDGELLTESMAIRLRHFAAGVGIVGPVSVLV